MVVQVSGRVQTHSSWACQVVKKPVAEEGEAIEKTIWKDKTASAVYRAGLLSLAG